MTTPHTLAERNLTTIIEALDCSENTARLLQLTALRMRRYYEAGGLSDSEEMTDMIATAWEVASRHGAGIRAASDETFDPNEISPLHLLTGHGPAIPCVPYRLAMD